MRQQVARGVWARLVLAGMVVLGTWTAASAQMPEATGRFVERVLRDDAGDHKYMVFVPAGYRSDRPSPAILFLHGAAERGRDNRLPLTVGLGPFVAARARTFPFLVVFPQCETTEGRILESWQADAPDGRRALAILDDAKKQFRIDDQRTVLTGWSMGGYGAWSLAMAEPARWSAVVPLSGGGDVEKVSALKDVPVWAFHGAKDTFIKSDNSRNLIVALNEAGGRAAYTELTDGAHSISEAVYGNDAVFQWMLSPRKAPAQLGTGMVKPVAAVQIPFVPALDVPEAVGVRLGNDALAALAFSIPQRISPQMLTGRLGDMFDSTVVEGRQFSIRFSGISYNGRVERVLVKGSGPDRLLVQIGVRNVTLTIGGTSVSGARHSAQAGPINIGIGHSYPVWLNLELSPYIDAHKIRLKPLGVSFQIPNDNWYVTVPAGVSTQGFGMTQERVSSGLVSGLYGSKARIENEVRAIAPNIVKQLEEQLVMPETGSAMSSLWRLPFSPPRFRVYPEQIVTDENGVSLVMGLSVASPDPSDSAKPLERLRSAGISLDKLAHDKALHVMVAPEILEPITQLVVDADQAKLDLLDIPEPLFEKLADRSSLEQIIPDLKQYGNNLQVRSTLRLVRPVSIREPTQSAATNGEKPFELKVPGMQIDIAIKTDPAETKWQSCASFDLRVSEQVLATLLKPAHELRQLKLEWLPASSVTGTGRFADSYRAKDSTLDADRYVEQFHEAWKAYTRGATVSGSTVSDLAMGPSKLRLHDVSWDAPTIDVAFKLARIKITNLSEESFTYQTKAPTSPWGEMLTLKPGDSHEFEIPYPLTYRRQGPKGPEVYTLVSGSHSEFRVPLAGGAPRLFAANKP